MAIGKKTGGGSRKGRPNKATARREAIISAAGASPLDYLLSIMRNEGIDRRERMDAAKAAAPYVHPRLAQITGNVDSTVTIKHVQFSEKDCIGYRGPE